MINLKNVGASARPALAGMIVAAMVLTGTAAQAQDEAANYPERPITLIIPFAPGAGNDILGREIAIKLSEVLGQPVVPENQPGAGGTAGVAAIANAAPDGYTIGMGSTSSMAINPATIPGLPYDPMTISPVIRLAETPYVLTVNPNEPFNTVQELIDYAKANPGVLNYGSAGVGTTNHLAGAIFAAMAGIELQHVPYSGANPAMTDVMAGEIQMTFAPILSGMPQVQAGTLRALGVSGLEASPAAPGVPTIAEAANLPDYNVVNWYGIIAPPNTPKPIVDKLNAEIAKIIKAPEMSDQLSKEGATIIADSPEAFGETIKSELVMWRDAAKLAGITQ